jgi:hypothetical protein
MAAPGGGSGGPNPDDFVRLKDTITAAGAQIDISLTQQINRFSGAARRAAKDSLKSLTAELGRAAKGVDKTNQLTDDLSKKFVSSKKIEESISKIKSRQVNLENTLLLLERQGVQLSAQEEANVEAINEALQEQIGLEEKLLGQAKARERAAGNIGKLFAGLTKIPILGSLIDAQEISEKINKTAAETGSKWKAFGTGVVETFKSIGRSLTDPSTIILGIFSALKKIVELVIQFNQKTFDLAKNLGTTVEEATVLQNKFVDMANSSQNLGLRASEIATSFAEISNSLGFIAPSNREFAETAALIQKRLGASAENMSALALQSALSGKTLEQTMGTLNASRNIEGARNKLLLSQKQMLDGISKVSSAVLVNFKGNVAELGNAVIRATKLGTTLDTVNKQGESLLDFESSISKEFEAQLLTGRDINLTRARDLALSGKTAELMEELNNQQVTYDSFMNQNVIARQAEAAAIGLSVEDLSKQLLLQKQAKELGAAAGQSAKDRYNELIKAGYTQEDIARKLGSEQEAADLRRASMQDKFQAAVEKLQDTLGQILQGPVGGIIDKFADFISKASNVKKIGDTIKSVFEGIGSILQRLPQYLEAAVNVSKILVSLSIARAVATISAVPGIGLVAGLAAYGALNNMVSSLGIPSSPPSAGDSTMETPVNPATAAAKAQESTQANNALPAPKPIFNVQSVTYVGTEKWDSQTRSSLAESPGMWAE